MSLLNIWQNQRYLQKELNEIKNRNRHFFEKKYANKFGLNNNRKG